MMKMDQIRDKVERALAEIRPYLEKDGGNVVLHEVTPDMKVKLGLLGACKSCSMSSMTMKAGIEETIRKYAPEIVEVISVNTPDEQFS